MQWSWFIVIGAVAGWLAGQFMRGNGFGLIGDIVVGIIGAFIGGYLFRAAGVELGGGLIGSLIVTFAGSAGSTELRNSARPLLVVLVIKASFVHRRGAPSSISSSRSLVDCPRLAIASG